MILYVVRHGIAEDAAPGVADAARRLTPKGRRRMQDVARGLRALGVAPAAVLTSPLPRAHETATIVAHALVDAPAPRLLDALAPEVPAVDTLRALRLFARHRTLMVVGHQPNLGRLLALLLAGSEDAVALDLRKGSCASLELSGLTPRSATSLRWLLPPRILRRIR